jgi:hypothetical protein
MNTFSTQYRRYKDRKSNKEKGSSIKYKTDFRFIQNYEANMEKEEKEKYEKNNKTFLQHFLDEKDSSGCTALQNAIIRYIFILFSLILFIISYVPITAKNSELTEDSKTCIQLIADRQFDYNSQDNTGLTPVMDAVNSGHLEIMQILFERSPGQEGRPVEEMVNPYLEDKEENDLKSYIDNANEDIKEYFYHQFAIDQL